MDRSAEGILKYLIELLEIYLEELSTAGGDKFRLGEKYAYTECLEIIREWENAEKSGLCYDVEKRFPIE